MNSNSIVIATLAALTTFAVATSAAADERGRWTFSAGTAWRSSVNLKTKGVLAPPPVTPCSMTKSAMSDSRNWYNRPHDLVPDPRAGQGGIPADAKLWGIDDARTEICGTPGSGYNVNSTKERSPIGLNLQAGYDFYRAETWSLGLNARFAGYWNMRSSTRGYYDAGTKQTEVWTDHYVFPEESPVDPFGPDPDYGTIVANGSDLKTSDLDTCGSRYITTRLRSDLYQIGLGPKVTWTPFAGRCECLEWLDVYGGVEVLGNIAHSKLDADRWGTTSTDFLIGFGGSVGLVGNITDWLGIYGQIGYEWIDKAEVSSGPIKSEIDYSSLVLAAGVQFRF